MNNFAVLCVTAVLGDDYHCVTHFMTVHAQGVPIVIVGLHTIAVGMTNS